MKKINLIAFISISFILIYFDTYRASHASFTHDESWSYLHYVDESIKDILTYHDSYANNHILNTLCMKAVKTWLGSSTLLLRLPNILAHVLFLVFTFKLLYRYCNKFFFPFFIMANANPYLIDYFSLARGYGMAIGLMMAGIYYYCCYLEKGKIKNHVFSLLFIGLATVANFALLNVFLVVVFAHNVFQMLFSGNKISFKNLLRWNIVNIIMGALLFSILYIPVMKLVEDNLIIVGGRQGFWKNTVRSLLDAFAYNVSYETILVTFWETFIVLISLLFIYKAITYIRNRKSISINQKIAILFGISSYFIALGTLVQYHLFNTPFLMGRFALFIFPLFTFLCIFLIADCLDGLHKYIRVTILFTLAGIFSIHTCYALSVNRYYDWKYDTDTKQMLKDLEKIQSKTHEQIFLGVTWIFEPMVDFYRTTQHLDWLIRVDRNGAATANNYFYLTTDDMAKIPNDEIEKEVCYSYTGNCLLKNIGKSAMVKSVYLQAFNGKYVSVDENTKNNSLAANRDTILSKEIFSMIALANHQCAFLAYNHLYLSAELGDKKEITATRVNYSTWETFTVINPDSNYVAFMADNKKYLSIDSVSTQVFAIADTIGKREKFRLIVP